MASGTRGYSSYRGRGRKGKIFLAILLICIILGSVGFIMAREHMRYDADGNLHFDLPWDKGTSDPVEAPGDPDVVIREPEQTTVKTPVRGTLLAAKPLTMEDQETAETPLSEAAVTAVTLKDSAGRVYFDSSAAVTGAVSVKPDTGEALNDLTARTAAAQPFGPCVHRSQKERGRNGMDYFRGQPQPQNGHRVRPL